VFLLCILIISFLQVNVPFSIIHKFIDQSKKQTYYCKNISKNQPFICTKHAYNVLFFIQFSSFYIYVCWTCPLQSSILNFQKLSGTSFLEFPERYF